MHRRCSWLVLAWVVSCGTPEAMQPSAPVGVEVPTSPPAAVEAQAIELPEESPRPSPNEVRRIRAEIRRARQQLRDDDPRALATFRALIESIRADPRVLCEGGYVALRAGEDELAGGWIRRGVRHYGDAARLPDTERTVLAQCHYNMGLVEERLGRADEATRSLRESLALRPNATVQARLDRLETGTSHPIRPTLARFPRHVVQESREALLADLERRVCEADRAALLAERECEAVELACTHEVEHTHGAGVARIEVVRVLASRRSHTGYCYDYDEPVAHWYLLLREGPRHHAFGRVANDGSGGWGPAQVQVDQLSRDGAVVGVALTYADCFSSGGCCHPMNERRATLCRVADGSARCAYLSLGHDWGGNCLQDEEDSEPPEISTTYAAAIELSAPDTIRFHWAGGSVQRALGPLLDACSSPDARADECALDRWPTD